MKLSCWAGRYACIRVLRARCLTGIAGAYVDLQPVSASHSASKKDGGGCRIRTYEALTSLPVFGTGGISRSPNPPRTLYEGPALTPKPESLFAVHHPLAGMTHYLNRAALTVEPPAFAMISSIQIVGPNVVLAPGGTAKRTQYPTDAPFRVLARYCYHFAPRYLSTKARPFALGAQEPLAMKAA